jgi:hypothetical protein
MTANAYIAHAGDKYSHQQPDLTHEYQLLRFLCKCNTFFELELQLATLAFPADSIFEWTRERLLKRLFLETDSDDCERF